ncbi:MAG: hypothetical protein R3C10_12640 [Pirellulales bacterium]
MSRARLMWPVQQIARRRPQRHQLDGRSRRLIELLEHQHGHPHVTRQLIGAKDRFGNDGQRAFGAR